MFLLCIYKEKSLPMVTQDYPYEIYPRDTPLQPGYSRETGIHGIFRNNVYLEYPFLVCSRKQLPGLFHNILFLGYCATVSSRDAPSWYVPGNNYLDYFKIQSFRELFGKKELGIFSKSKK